MKKPIYSVYDRIAENYGPLQAFLSDNVAKRAFNEGCKIGDGMKLHPQDLEMHRIGWFDEEKGSFLEDKEIIEKGAKQDDLPHSV